MATHLIEDEAIEQVMGNLELVLRLQSDEHRHGQLGVALRTITDCGAEVNPDFDRDACELLSCMLTERWERITDYMAGTEGTSWCKVERRLLLTAVTAAGVGASSEDILVDAELAYFESPTSTGASRVDTGLCNRVCLS